MIFWYSVVIFQDEKMMKRNVEECYEKNTWNRPLSKAKKRFNNNYLFSYNVVNKNYLAVSSCGWYFKLWKTFLILFRVHYRLSLRKCRIMTRWNDTLRNFYDQKNVFSRINYFIKILAECFSSSFRRNSILLCFSLCAV